MTDISALRTLRDKVEAGEWPDDFLAIDSKTPLQKVTTATLYSAFSGSLDAAKGVDISRLLQGDFARPPAYMTRWHISEESGAIVRSDYSINDVWKVVDIERAISPTQPNCNQHQPSQSAPDQ